MSDSLLIGLINLVGSLVGAGITASAIVIAARIAKEEESKKIDKGDSCSDFNDSKSKKKKGFLKYKS